MALCRESVRGSGDVLTAVCRDNEIDSGSCSKQTAHSHDVNLSHWPARHFPQHKHTDMYSHTHIHTLTHTHRSPGCWSQMPAVSTQHAIRINDFQKAEETKVTKNVNTVETIRVDHTTGEIGKESHCSLISLGDLTLYSISTDHLLRRSTRARPGSVLSAPDSIPYIIQGAGGLCWLTTVTIVQ